MGALPTGPGFRSQRTRVFGILLIAGGLLAGVTVILPPEASGSDTVVIALGAAAGVAGVALVLIGRELDDWQLGTVGVLGTILITAATYEGGFDGTGTADNEMLYIWVCLFSFYFLRLRVALVELAVVAIAYGWLLSRQGIDGADAVTRWIVTVSALGTVGALVASLRTSLDGLVGELSSRARVDPLTGLLNRNALEERAAIEFARARRTGGPVAILVCDIDDFKTINDSLGHPAGDQVLARVSEVLSSETRTVDAVARLGGDEFAVLLPGATAVAARMIAERLRVAVRRSAGDAHLRLTLSLGIAVGHPGGSSLDGLWKAADRAMYAAKRSGGDAVATAPEFAETVGPRPVEPDPISA